MKFLKLIRWPNLLIIILVQYLIRFSIIESLNVPHVLDHFYFFLGVLCSISLAAAGNIINDLYDIKVDEINKPERVVINKGISENTAWGLFSAFNIVAFISGYILAEHIEIPGLWLLPVVAAALLYLYAADLKKRPLIGNVIVSLMTALPVLLVGVYDVIPAGNADNADVVLSVFKVILGFSAFAFFLNLIREIIKDTEDLEGDKQQGYNTLAVIVGLPVIKYVVVILIAVLAVFTGYFNYYLLLSDQLSAGYVLLFINLPLAFLLFKVLIAKSKKDYKKASMLIKLIMLTGMLSMAVFTLSITLQF